MKRLLCKTVYDTETAAVVHKHIVGQFGDPAGYEEILFRTPSGAYFVYGNGGDESPYPSEKITRISKDKIQAWIESH